MGNIDLNEMEVVTAPEAISGADLLRPLIGAQAEYPSPASTGGIVVGELIALKDDGRTPLVRYPRQPGTAALAARSVVDLYGAHIGRQVVLMFEEGNSAWPIVIGVLREGAAPLGQSPGQVEVDADGERLVVSAKEQIVLLCGEASITLTKAGKVLIQGTYVSTRSIGVNRVKGASVQIN